MKRREYLKNGLVWSNGILAPLAVVSGFFELRERTLSDKPEYDTERTSVETAGDGMASWTWAANVRGTSAMKVRLTLYDRKERAIGKTAEVLRPELFTHNRYEVTYLGPVEEVNSIVDYTVDVSYVEDSVR